MKNPPVPSPTEYILRVRGQSVILDADMAKLYGVTTKRLNEQVRRNEERFPKSFMFQLKENEWERLRSQFATSKKRTGRGGRRYLPYVFTEHGALMAANILNSPEAIKMSVAVVEAFVRLRRMALSVESMARKVNQLEKKYDKQFQVIFQAVRELMKQPETKRKKIGF